jgi:heme-degrading monooxygenase HmoA
MEFEEKRIPAFLDIFSNSRDRIRGFPGCEHLQLLQDETDFCVFFTYSHWSREGDLVSYRNSELFKTVWSETKKLFRAAPQAWSLSDQTWSDQTWGDQTFANS